MCLETGLLCGLLTTQCCQFTELGCCCICTRWACKRCCMSGSMQSEYWPEATPEEFKPIPRYCQLILAVYEKDLQHPEYADQLDVANVEKVAGYEETKGLCPPYIIYVDHKNKDVAVGIRGLHLGKRSDYVTLLKLPGVGVQKFDGGYIHTRMFKCAKYLLKQEGARLETLMKAHKDYTLTFAGHSLGSGVAALATVIAFNKRSQFGIRRHQLRCYAIAPARTMSLNLAVKYAPVINSVILQDDFLPRTSTPIEEIFALAFCCLCCVLTASCLRDTCISQESFLKDKKRLYPPGRLFHIVDRECCGMCSYHTPVVRTAIPVRERFERMVVSCNMTDDHSLVTIEKEAQKAMQRLEETGAAMDAPEPQRMEREESPKAQYNDAAGHSLVGGGLAEHVHDHSPSSHSPPSVSTSRDSSNPSSSDTLARESRWYNIIDAMEEPDVHTDAEKASQQQDDKWWRILSLTRKPPKASDEHVSPTTIAV